MDQADIEYALSRALDHAVPDVKDEIMRRCAEEHSEQDYIVPMDLVPKKRRRKSYISSYVAAAAILLLFINIGGSILRNRQETRPETIIGLDVNPSIELAINVNNRVIQATAVNAEAKEVLANMDLNGATTEVAVNAVLGSMLKLGYLNESSNSILISVDNKDEESSREIETKLVEDVNETLQSYFVDASILSQTVTMTDTSVSQTAEDYEISQGRTILIQKILDNNPDYTFDELSQLTINELNLLLNSERVEVQNVTTTGVASEASYIGQEAAIDVVFSVVAVSREQITDLYSDIDVLNSRMVYSVSFLYNDLIYCYEVDALNGEILANYVDYPVTEVPLTADITEVLGGNGEPETAGNESLNSASQNTLSDNAISENEVVSENEAVSENGIVSQNDVVSENEAVSENRIVSQNDAVSENETSTDHEYGAEESEVNDSGIQQEGSSDHTVSENTVSANESGEVSDEEALEGKYSIVFGKYRGILSDASLLWEEGRNGEADFGTYASTWMTVNQFKSQILTHAQVSRTSVVYTYSAVYQMDELDYYILEFETETHAYQYILEASGGTIAEYEMRLLQK